MSHGYGSSRSRWVLLSLFCRRRFGEVCYFAYQPEMKSGWLLVTTCLGGSVPLWGSSLSGGLKLLHVLEASGSHGPTMCWPPVIFYSRIVQRQQSMLFSICCSRRQQQTFFLRRGGCRPQIADASRRWRGKPGDGYKDWAVISISFKSIFVTWAVIIKNINEISTRFLKKNKGKL